MNSRGKYLLENHPILAEPSATAFVFFRNKPQAKSHSLLAGALGGMTPTVTTPIRGNNTENLRSSTFSIKPLPATDDEVKAIASAFIKRGYRTRVLLGKNFTQKNLQDAMTNAGYIHLATHGFLSRQGRGLFSGLLTSDGYVYVSDIFRWSISPRVVVLSACQTALGELSRGDDLTGLSRAFLQAGANNLVATLWNVEDRATAKLMEDFYQLMLEGVPPETALQQAQKKLMKIRKDPFFWGPFVIYGR